MSAVPRVVVVTGPKGSGKSTLIKVLYPELPVRFTEPYIYRVYEVQKGLKVVEVQDKEEALRVLLAAPPWRISVGIMLVEAAQQVRANPLMVNLIATAQAKALVLSKADKASSESVLEARREAERLRLEFFSVSSVTGQGVEELRRWVETGERPEAAPPQPAAAPTARPPPVQPLILVDVVPVPSGKEPRAGELSEEEIRFLRLCDGKKPLSEVASTLGITYGRAKSIADKLFSAGYLSQLRVATRA